MSMQIPGLIAKKDTKNSNLSEAEIQAKRDSFEAYIKSWKPDTQKVGYMSSNLNSGLNTGDVYSPYIDPLQQYPQQPYQQPFDWEWKNPGPFGQPDRGLKPSPNRSGNYNTQDMADYLQAMLKPKKSEFEVLLDAMFDTSEKEQFLITLGFEFKHENGEDWIERTVAGLLEKGKKAEIFDKIFLREMTIKFKNLLISKNSLKLKI